MPDLNTKLVISIKHPAILQSISSGQRLMMGIAVMHPAMIHGRMQIENTASAQQDQ
jgi:hypothetical protein